MLDKQCFVIGAFSFVLVIKYKLILLFLLLNTNELPAWLLARPTLVPSNKILQIYDCLFSLLNFIS